MSYLVLARKYRPQDFDEVIGQEHISELLKKAIQGNRIAHGYLFCGPRGVGKTSCARILAKCLNCQTGPTLKPCGNCSSCKEIAGGNSFDVLEIDGASNRGIDEIRVLRENVKFAPSYGKFKIYIIDEVHMLTTEAFNALLKTLEEPPPHVKFILATTAPHKVPVTIISRCQRFDFKRISIQTVVKALTKISEQEKLNVEPPAFYAVAKACDGSLRDALSIFDQLSALSERQINAQDVFSMLGLVETELLFELVNAVAEKNCAKALDVFSRIVDQGKDVKQLLKDLTEHFRHLMIVKVGGKSLGRMIDYPVSIKDMLLEQSGRFSLPEILKAIDTLIDAQETSRITESLYIPIEIALAKLTYSKEELNTKISKPTPSSKGSEVFLKEVPSPAVTKNSIPVEASKPQKFSPVNVLKNERGEVSLGGEVDEIPENIEEQTMPAMEIVEEVSLEKIQRSWDALTFAVSREKMSVATFLHDAKPVGLKGPELLIGLPETCAFQKENLEIQANVKLVERIFSEKLKTAIYVKYTLENQSQPTEETSVVKNVLETFKGKVVNRWYNE